MSYNKITLLGRLVRDPELRYVGDNIPMCTFTLAVNRRKQGEVDFIRIKTWNKLAENCAKYLVKGQQAMVDGELNINKGEQNGIVVYYTDVNSNRVVFLSKPSSGETSNNDLPYVAEGRFDDIDSYHMNSLIEQGPPASFNEPSYKSRSNTFGGTEVVDMASNEGAKSKGVPF